MPEQKHAWEGLDHDDEVYRKKLPFDVTSTNIRGVYGIPAPPDDLDPRTASQRDLIRHGIFWRKPQAEDTARNAALDEFFSRKWLAKDRVIPEFDLNPTRRRRPEGRGQRGTPRKLTTAGPYLNPYYAGATMSNGYWDCVVATWNVPAMTIPGSAEGVDGGWDADIWIGLDDVDLVNGMLVGGEQSIQAGVSLYLDDDGHPFYQAWWAWLTLSVVSSPTFTYPMNVTNFYVDVGHQIYCSILYLGPVLGILRVHDGCVASKLSRLEP